MITLLFIQASPDLVDVKRMIPEVVVDLRYATSQNFTHRRLYSAARCLLLRPVASQLKEVEKELRRHGLGLKIWDAYRPLSVTRQLWKLVHDERYVANPIHGSRHNRGCAVDATLVDDKGRELPMPTQFDDFTPRAHRSYIKLNSRVLMNRRFLQEAMERHGFVGLPTEWWHFDAKDWRRHPILDIPLEEP
ncbi:M15 family metallopeptidase [Fimbriimonas ginsengisoli]|uniref:D-alanyl-D-alanine dipeptidase n=1 Tax=Fimbriimonas ginsengisoli Gsoil 348 TaxID=661478 RepID=A0A068NJD6_FIMGI|nr:M15 family metallopeptidase [Fimbriimonas ginsengisoli]AIE83601.1 peptidase M15D vanX D-ala-D-ala dipeptidase [Fimbriimonas ginsengisoli Gsoil 348]